MKVKVKPIIKGFLILLTFGTIIYALYYSIKKYSDPYFDYRTRSLFYQQMRKNDEFDLIKTAEKELKNLDDNIQKYKSDDCIFLRHFLTEQKILLIQEIEKIKINIYSKEGGLIYRDKIETYKEFQKKYPELVSKFQDYGKVLEYDEIDYLDAYDRKVEKETKGLSKNAMTTYELGNFGLKCEYKMTELWGIENFGLTPSELDLVKTLWSNPLK